jgi:hypothetical protein
LSFSLANASDRLSIVDSGFCYWYFISPNVLAVYYINRALPE